jgi:hypothetical protein
LSAKTAGNDQKSDSYQHMPRVDDSYRVEDSYHGMALAVPMNLQETEQGFSPNSA